MDIVTSEQQKKNLTMTLGKFAGDLVRKIECKRKFNVYANWAAA